MRTLVFRGRIVSCGLDLADGVVAVAGDRIIAVGDAATYPAERLPGPMGTLLPGLVDIHCHGGGGASFTTGDDADLTVGSAHHLGAGTTSVVASAVTDSPERMIAAVGAAAAAVDRHEVAAIHVEGPFLAAGRCGAQDPRHLRMPDLGLTRALLEAGRGHVRAMTVAPELPGADVVMELLADHDVIPAVGHTEADTATAERALTDFGEGLATHLFNGMPPLHHRAPGPVAASLVAAARGSARVELIADGVHISDDTVRMVFALLGPSRIALVSDATAAAGMPDGDYRLGPQEVTVVGGVARLGGVDGVIAGGAARLLDIVRRCVQHAGISLRAAVTAASSTPAAVYGLDGEVGALRPGLRADVCVVDGDLRVRQVLQAGRWVV
jgi:N-acetylglucosamine-6-phosphate deacetylase